MASFPDRPSLLPSVCPVCGAQNRCAMEIERETGQAQPPCWCTQVDFSRELLEGLPANARGIACICERCARGAGPHPNPLPHAGEGVEDF